MKIEVPEKLYSYAEYQQLILDLLELGKVTGDEQSESLFEYTKLNTHRMHRWEKTFSPNATLSKKITELKKSMHWIVITEGWCGDAAQQIPVIERLGSLNPLIKTHYVLRDENPALMNLFLTNGSKAIPVWICLDAEGEILWTWGPRPKAASDLLNQLRADGVDVSIQKQELHSWYAKNKHQSFQSEIEQLITQPSVL
jgi:hypothetical protein